MGYTAPVCLGTQRIHDGGTVNALGTPRGARFARHALPDRLRPQRRIGIAELQGADQSVRRDVHSPGTRTPGRAFATLITIRKTGSGEGLQDLNHVELRWRAHWLLANRLLAVNCRQMLRDRAVTVRTFECDSGIGNATKHRGSSGLPVVGERGFDPPTPWSRTEGACWRQRTWAVQWSIDPAVRRFEESERMVRPLLVHQFLTTGRQICCKDTMTTLSDRYPVCNTCGLSRLAGGYSIPNSTSDSVEFLDLETSSQATKPLCSPRIRREGRPEIFLWEVSPDRYWETRSCPGDRSWTAPQSAGTR